MPESVRQETHKQGVAVSAGIAIGRAYLIGRDTLKAPRHHIDADDIDTEVARLRKALAASDKQLERVKVKLASENESDYHIISAHQLMLHDEHLADAAVGYINTDLVCAEWALRKAVDDIAAVFHSIEDEYLRERLSDVEFVFERVLRNLLGRDTGPLSPPPDAVVVAYDLSPADTSMLHKAAVAGLLTDAGGRTSHTAIIARAHEIPAVVGLEDITELVETDDLLIVDGGAGMVIVNPTAATVAKYREEQWRQVAAGAQLLTNRDLPAQTLCGEVRVQLYANIDSPEELDDAIEYGAEGIGLVRTEYLYMTSEALPDEETHLRNATLMVQRMAGRPATLRTFDLGADKLARFLEDARLEEANPALGLRSIRLCLTELGMPLFRTQLRGLLRASAHGPLRIMFPMISGIGELRAAKAVLEDVRAELRSAGEPFDETIKVGIMIEMPSAAVTADLLALEADFFSIGTNDLIQYTMAVDRVNEFVSYLYEPLHPALLRLIGGVAKAAKHAGISVTVCGEMAGDPAIAPVLLGLGIYELSMSAVAIPEVKAVIRAMTLAGARALVDKVLTMPTAEDVREAVRAYLATLGLSPKGAA
jgi:phosphoenolpyruvate-protein phosphotransferase (PTS system enzyme I)